MSATYLHHVLVHFPIALLTVAAVAHLLALVHRWYGWRVVGGVALLAGTTGAVAAVAAGLGAYDRAIAGGLPEAAVDLHRTLGIATLVAALLASGAWIAGAAKKRLRAPGPAAAVAFLSLAAAGAVTITGHFGGTLLHPDLAPFAGVREFAGVAPEEGGEETQPERGDFTRGAFVYADSCAGCHGPEGGGVPAVGGPAVFGNDALAVEPPEELDRERRFETGADVLAYVKETMPRDDPGGLSDEGYREVVRYLLYQRGIDVPEELSDEAAREIRINEAETSR